MLKRSGFTRYKNVYEFYSHQNVVYLEDGEVEQNSKSGNELKSRCSIW